MLTILFWLAFPLFLLLAFVSSFMKGYGGRR